MSLAEIILYMATCDRCGYPFYRDTNARRGTSLDFSLDRNTIVAELRSAGWLGPTQDPHNDFIVCKRCRDAIDGGEQP